MKIAVIGLGLIGGSFALEMKRLGHHVVGFEADETHAKRAIERRLVDQICTMDECIEVSDLLVLATPVDAISALLPELLAKIKDHQVVIDFGSTKGAILAEANKHVKRGRYVACHPMAGTEFSGPEAAVTDLFANKFVVICDRDDSDADALSLVNGIFDALKMKTVHYSGDLHDIHAAFVSHISHISSFSLALTVLEKEKNEKDIFQLAAGGFTSTVRLAKSAPHTWVPIFLQNRHHLLEVLQSHIEQLRAFELALSNNSASSLQDLIERANHIKKII